MITLSNLVLKAWLRQLTMALKASFHFISAKGLVI